MSRTGDEEVSVSSDNGVVTKVAQDASSEDGKDRNEFYLKEETRKQRNRQHARVSRERKQRQFELLQEENVRLRNGVADLERQVAVNFNEIQYLRELYQRSERENLYLRGQLQGFSQVQPWPPPGSSPPGGPQQPPQSSPSTAPSQSQPPQPPPQQSQMNSAAPVQHGVMSSTPLQQQQQAISVAPFYHQQQRDS